MPSEKFYKETYTAPLSKLDRSVLAAMCKAPVAAANMNWLVAGGSDDMRRHRVFVSKLRVKLKGTGWTVVNTVRGGHAAGFYKLVREGRSYLDGIS